MFDAYHCALRLASIAADCDLEAIEWDRMRILDFFAACPHLLKTIRLPVELRSRKRILKTVREPYESFPSTARLFFQLGEIQATAARLLVASGVFARDAMLTGLVELGEGEHRPVLGHITEQAQFRSSEWYRFITKDLCKLPLQGKDGLKERSGVMEFRHDPV